MDFWGGACIWIVKILSGSSGETIVVDGEGTEYIPDGSDISFPSESSGQQQRFLQYFEYGTPQAILTPLDPHAVGYAEANDDGVVVWKHGQDVSGNTHVSNDFNNNPYAMEMDTAEGGLAGWHTPYTSGDLERILRASDADAEGLEATLYEDLALCLNVPEGSTGESVSEDVLKILPEDLKKLRERITTESWDLPVPGLSWPTELADALTDTPTAGHITDLFAARFAKEDASLSDDDARQRAADLLENAGKNSHRIASSLLRGTRMNVNRLFGNGDDDSAASDPGYGVVDEPSEALIDPTQSLIGETITAPDHDDIKFDHDGDGSAASDTPDPDDSYARQHYAQQLYLLLMLLADDLETNVPGIIDPDDQRRLLARRLAQFAVNAVDYRDPDSIMTPFEYDANPFDAGGWLAEADGDLTTSPSSKTEYGVVWGL